MNFTYEGADTSLMIKRYLKNGDDYLIEYLDGKISEYTCYNDKEEQRIKNIMLEQAKKRQEK